MGRQVSVYLEKHQIEKVRRLVDEDTKLSSFSQAVRWIINRHFSEEH